MVRSGSRTEFGLRKIFSVLGSHGRRDSTTKVRVVIEFLCLNLEKGNFKSITCAVMHLLGK